MKKHRITILTKRQKASVILITLMLLISLPAQVHALTYFGTPQTLDSAGDVGWYTSLAIVNGYPAISYFDDSNRDLKFICANNADGTTWDTPQTLDSTGDVGRYTSLAIVNGNPAISYWDESNGYLKFIRANTADGIIWSPPQTVDSSGYVGKYSSLAIVNGNPAISYYDYSYRDLKFIRANDADGTSWGTPQTLDSTGAVGEYNSLAIVNGNPAISYFDASNRDLKFIRATNASGTSWGIPQTLDSYGHVGAFTSLEIVNGNPAISYDATNDDLKFIRATNASGTSWGTPQTLDSAGIVGLDTSLAIFNGNPAISYSDATNEDLKFIRANNADGTSWGSPQIMDSAGIIGGYTSLAIVNGNPAISYFDASNRDLKYINVTSVDIAVANAGTSINNGDTLDFGTTSLNNPVTRTLTITNNGDSALDLTRLSLPAGYSFTGSIPTDVATGGSENIVIELKAVQTGTFTGNLEIGSTDTNQSPFTIALTGEVTETHGEIIVMDGSTNIDDGSGSFDYGTTTVGTPVSHTFTIENSSTEDLNLYSLGLPTGFSLQGTYKHTLITNETTNITVRLDALSVGTYSGQFSLANDDADENPFNFTIEGVVADTSGEIAVLDGLTGIADGETNPIDFGDTTLGNPISRTFTIQNLGSNVLDLYSLTLPNGFSLQGSYNHAVAANSSTNITVQLDSQFVGSYIGEIFLSSDDTDENPFNFTIEGVVADTSGEIAVLDGLTGITDGETTPINFGDTTLGTPLSRTFTIRNLSNNVLDLYSLTLPNGFSLQGTYSHTVAANSSTSITVQLDSQFVGSYSGEFSLSSDDTDENPFNFTIEGVVADTSGEIAVLDGLTGITDGETTPINFGDTTLGTPLSRTFTIRNLSNNVLDLYSLTLPNGFSLQGTYNYTVAANSSTSITIQLDSQIAGSYSGQFSLSNDDTDENPFNFTISGVVNNPALETGVIAPLSGSTMLDSAIQVSFNHDVLHDGSAEAANNPINYLLVEDGANGLFDTTTCLLGLAGDDVQQPISSVTYDDSTYIATINTDPLPAGRYQLLACGTASIQDATGNVLNGGAFDSSTTFTVVSASSGTSSASGASVALLPATGFAPHRNTLLNEQPASAAYSDMDSLSLQIPSLKVDVPIVGVPQTNTGWDVTWLTNAQAGWLNGTAYPTWDGNTVLTGHVTNASGNPGPFANIKSLKFGDQLTIQAYGETYTYEVRENKLVTSDDMSIIEEHKSRDWVTLITCEYFNENTGQYLYRRVVRAVLVVVK